MSRETIRRFQRMTPAERFEIARALQEEAWEQLESLPEAERERRWQIIRRMHDQFGERVLAHLRQHDR
jgi:hypothetical protein